MPKPWQLTETIYLMERQTEYPVSEEQKTMEPIRGFDGYFVSRTGEIFSTKNKAIRKLVPTNTTWGYPQVSLCKDRRRYGKRVHRLVAEHFYGVDNTTVINHRNGDKQDNRLENLEISSPKENSRHAWAMGLCESARKTGENSYLHKLTDSTVLDIFALRDSGKTQKEVGLLFAISRHQVGRIWNRTTRKAQTNAH